MKRILITFSIIAVAVYFLHAQNTLPKYVNKAYKRGELLTYNIHYGPIDAVTATIEVTQESQKYYGRPTMHIVGNAKSKGTFNFFFKVRDRYETYIDEESLLPMQFIRNIDEGGYRLKQNYLFNHANKTISLDGKPYNEAVYLQDMMSSFFYARCVDLSNAKPLQIFEVPTIVDGEMYKLQIKFLTKEVVKTSFGKINCLKFVPIVQKGRIFKKEEDLIIWISDDANHIPIKAKAEILFGSLKIDLVKYTGLANPITFVK
jgi:hypothetical protein